jgi:uncharacterized membrane protein YkoI
MALVAAVIAAMVLPAHAQGQGQGQGQGQEGQGQESQGQGGQGRGSQGQESQEQGSQGQGSQGQGIGPPGNSPGSGGRPGGAGETDGDFALEAVRSQRALPLADILATARQDVPGEVIDARLVTIRGFLVYEVKSMTGDGHVSRSYYYARSGRKVSTD